MAPRPLNRNSVTFLAVRPTRRHANIAQCSGAIGSDENGLPAGWIGPSQTGGSRTNAVNVTWSTEFKFSSRFFHIYVLGRGWCAGRAAGVRRAHAIYDAETDRIVWMRWNLSSRGSLADIGQ